MLSKLGVFQGFAIFMLAAVAFSSAAGDIKAQSRHNQTTQGTNGDNTKPGATGADSGLKGDTVPGGTGSVETVEGDVIRVDTALVTVPVSVKDANGRAVPNLRQNSFHIFDENVEQKIAYFATVDQPFTVVLIIDTSRSTHFKLEDIQEAAISFVQQLQPEDRVMVMSFDSEINVLAEPTNDRSLLSNAIRRTRTGTSTRLYDAVDFVLSKRLNHIPGRKAVVLFTDGVDTTSRDATYESTVQEAESQDALIYTVEYDTSKDQRGGGGRGRGRGRSGGGSGWPFPGGGGMPGSGGGWPGSGGGNGGGRSGGGGGNGGGSGRGSGRGSGAGSGGEYARADAYLHDLPTKTGARNFNGDTLGDVTTAFAQVADELRRQYSIGYYPRPVGQVGQRRQIRVQVNQPELVVSSRDSYIFAGKKAATQASGQQQP